MGAQHGKVRQTHFPQAGEGNSDRQLIPHAESRSNIETSSACESALYVHRANNALAVQCVALYFPRHWGDNALVRMPKTWSSLIRLRHFSFITDRSSDPAPGIATSI